MPVILTPPHTILTLPLAGPHLAAYLGKGHWVRSDVRKKNEEKENE